MNQRVFKPSLFDCGSFRSLSSVESTVNNGRDKAAFISEGDEAMQMGEESSECGFPVNEFYEFSVRSCDINV